MYFWRFQWNCLGENLEFSGSDMDYHTKASARISVAGFTNRSPYTRFSRSGSENLEGFELDNPGIADWIPQNLEFATWFSEYKPSLNYSFNKQRETTFAFNCFFTGHRIKLTAELSYFDFFEATLPSNTGWRFRLQRDISIW